MRIRIFSMAALSLVLLFIQGCEQTSVEQQLVGKWQMDAVIQNNNDVTAEHNPENDRWIDFLDDKTFKTGGTPYGENHGTWYLKNDDTVLYLNSSQENDDSEWNLTIDGNNMQWTGIGDPGKEAFLLKHRRVAD